jgi:hypothetical protein
MSFSVRASFKMLQLDDNNNNYVGNTQEVENKDDKIDSGSDSEYSEDEKVLQEEKRDEDGNIIKERIVKRIFRKTKASRPKSVPAPKPKKAEGGFSIRSSQHSRFDYY